MKEKISAEGYLTSLAEKVLSGDYPDSKDKLVTAQLERIATLLGHLSKTDSLYKILFEQENQLIELDGVQINTKDLMWFVLMDHSAPRGCFWKSKGRATEDSTVSKAVPLAFLGASRVYNKSYESWWDIDELKRTDMFLPKGLNTWKISEIDGRTILEEEVGLIRLRLAEDFELSVEDIRKIREEVPKFATTHSPRMIPSKTLDNERTTEIYNKCSRLMRCLLIQGWIYYNKSRNDGMILDYKNWDNKPASIDNMGVANLEGLKPTKSKVASGYLAFTKG